MIILLLQVKKYFYEIRQEIVHLGIDENIIIQGWVFNISNFDFGRYIKLLENPITILTEDCMGGYLYKNLGLKFSSPTINTLLMKSRMHYLFSYFTEYIDKPLELYREGSLRKMNIQ